ncbi:MAG: SPFH domain-containing protein [Chitinophagales bacterium]
MNPFKKDKRYIYNDAIATGLAALFAISIVIGGAFYLLDIVVTTIINFVQSNLNQIFLLLISALLLSLFILGFQVIKIGHKGILLNFGKRTKTIFEEGIAWALPPFQEILEVDCTQRFLNKKNIRFNINSFIPVEINVSAYYYVSNLYNFF